MIKAAIIGASGYSGAELVKILTRHAGARAIAATSKSSEGRPIAELYPNFSGHTDLTFTAYHHSLAAQADVIFLALPHGQAMNIVPELRATGPAKIIDLSGDFRLPAGVYERWYKQPHAAPELIPEAVYGLSEINRDRIARADFIANPGCFPTGVVLAVAPLAAAGKIAGPVIADCLTGVSGAGRGLSETTQFCRADENAAAYKAGGTHQHIPEMEKTLAELALIEIKVSFTPILAPFSRGIYTVCNTAPAGEMSLEQAIDIYTRFYADKPLVRMLPAGVLPQIKAVAGSNFCHIGLALDERAGRLIAVSAIDNLVKGAAGQAVQNMNIMFGLDETAGLDQMGLYP